MEVHVAAPAVGKRMWSYLRAVFFMVRKGLLSNKRKLLLGMHLLIKRRNKAAVERTIATLLSHHHHGHGHALRRRDYEFSCSNSPDPASTSRRRLAYFPCLGAVHEDDDHHHHYHGGYSLAAAASPAPIARIQYYAAADDDASPAPSSPGILLGADLAPGEDKDESSYCCACASPALPSAADAGAFSVRVSNFSSEEYEEAAGALGGGGGGEAVDDEAEEFIRRFYDQLRRQNTIALLPYMQQHESISAA